MGLIAVSCKLQNKSAKTGETGSQETSIFPKGEKTPQKNFTGTTLASRLVQMDAPGTYSIGYAIFEPGARTN